LCWCAVKKLHTHSLRRFWSNKLADLLCLSCHLDFQNRLRLTSMAWWTGSISQPPLHVIFGFDYWDRYERKDSHKIKNCTTFVSKHKIYDIVQVLIFKLTWISVISVELTEALLRNKSVKRLVITTFWPCWISVDALSFQSLHVIVCLSSVSVMSCLTQLCPFFMSST